MTCGRNALIFSMLMLLLTLESTFLTLSHSKSIVKTLPGYPGELPFKLETGYVGIGEKEDAQFFYYFVESERNPEEDPFIFDITGGPGATAVISFFYEFGPLSFNFDNAPENVTITLNPNSWTKMANMLFVDMPIGAGYSYAKTSEAWLSSDSIWAQQANDVLRKFLIDHPKFLKNPLYIGAISYVGIILPIITLEIYNANERDDQPALNIQGYILFSPLTDKFMDQNSRFEYAHRMALISDEIYKSGVLNCHGNYINTNTANSACKSTLERYMECISRINLQHILDPFCNSTNIQPYCIEYSYKFVEDWANDENVQQALNVRQGTIENWVARNLSMVYADGKNDTFCYSFDIASSFAYHKKLVSKNCRALIISGDHDMISPYQGVEQWIVLLNLSVESPWKPFYVDNQVGGYEMTYAKSDFSLTFSTIKGAGHSVPMYKPKEAMVLARKWLALETYSNVM